MKNHTDVLIFHIAVCDNKAQTAFIAEEKSPARIFLRVPPQNLLRNGGLMAANMLNDIASEHRARMLNLKKYYPFFRLTEISLSQFKDGKYQALDMGYIVMGILRFFIEENNFNEKDVTYPEYLEFIHELISRDFGLSLSEEENKEIGGYIFDKIKNDGRPFDFEYFDPIDRKKRVSRVRMIESSIRDNTVLYSISAEAVEFYLDTKEIREESRISVQQLLLEKMIRAKNFKGGAEVVWRINEEVSRLTAAKNEVMNTLSSDVFAGIEAYEEFVRTGMRWFEEEERLFKKNSELIKAARSKLSGTERSDAQYYRTVSEVYELENQLKVAMNRHGELLRACTDMQRLTDDAVRRAKLGQIRSHVDFASLLKRMVETDNAAVLAELINPLFMPKTKKTFNAENIDEALTVRPARYQEAEKVSAEPPREIVYEDELEEQRISHNYAFIMENLLAALSERERFTLKEFNEAMSRRYSENILKNADYFSFFVNLCQKNSYVIGGQEMSSDSFLDEILKAHFSDRERTAFSVACGSRSVTEPAEGCEVTDVVFQREK